MVYYILYDYLSVIETDEYRRLTIRQKYLI